MDFLRKDIYTVLKEALASGEPPVQQNPGKPQSVRFNPGLETEYIVTFSERGFLLDGTRLSFEEIQSALSKEYTINLKGGILLDAVKMQQILKYKDIY